MKTIIVKTNDASTITEQHRKHNESGLVMAELSNVWIFVPHFPFFDYGFKLTFVPWVDDKKRFGL